MPHARRRITALGSLLALGGCSSGGTARQVTTPSPASGALAASLDRLAPRWLAEARVPSLAVAYIKDGAVQWTRAYGEQAPGVPATTRTLYNVASLTKPVFAETMLRLVADGQLTLDEPLSRYWVDPDLTADARTQQLTARIALTHRTGFANWRRETGGRLAFRADPGSVYGYSGEGMEYLARAAEKRTGLTLEQLVQRHLFDPFGMRDAGWPMRAAFEGRLAVPSGPDGSRREPDIAATASAADNLLITVGDYATFVARVMASDALPRWLRAERDSLQAVDPSGTQPCNPATNARCPRRGGYGLGWSVLEFEGETVLWHTGADWGERTMVFYVPARREGAVLFTNSFDGFNVIIPAGMALVSGTPFADFLASGTAPPRKR